MTAPDRSDGAPVEGSEAGPSLRRLHVIGAGLIGTSIGLAAAAGSWRVSFEDREPERASRAAQRLRARAHEADSTARPPGSASERQQVDIVCVAVPPAETAAAVIQALRLYRGSTVIDVASVKTEPQLQVDASDASVDRYVATHPLAGGEGHGPDAGRSDLLAGRSWVLCVGAASVRHVARVLELVDVCGAHPVRLSATEHDRLLAVTSHLPQLLASALAAEVAATFSSPDSPPDVGVRGAEPVPASSLAGPALWDMTRIAGSPAELWSQIAGMNHEALNGALSSLLERLRVVGASLGGSPAEAVTSVRDLVEDGRAARLQLGLKHQAAGASGRVPTSSASAVPGADTGWTWAEFAIDDTPGTLARIFAAAGRLGLNVEDVRVDHAPYASSGIVGVALRQAADAQRLRAELDGRS